MSQLSILDQYKNVEGAPGYKTAFDSEAKSYRLIRDNGKMDDKSYKTRKKAEKHARSIAKMSYVAKSWRDNREKAIKILGNELYEDFASYNFSKSIWRYDTDRFDRGDES